jgi:hypothetical protein
MNINEAYPSKYLKAADLNGKNVTVTIKSAEVEEIGFDKERKIVLSFVGKDKQFVCNKTNAGAIAKMFGAETNDWAGQRITLCAREVEFQGSTVPALRVLSQKPEAHKTAPPPGQTVPPPAPPVQAAPPPAEDEDDDIPF